MTVARLWKATLVDGRAEEYEAFARDISLPMFRMQQGFKGVAMMRNGKDSSVLTLWRDEQSIRQLDRSESYLATVGMIMATGLLQDVGDAVLSDLHLADLRSISIA